MRGSSAAQQAADASAWPPRCCVAFGRRRHVTAGRHSPSPALTLRPPVSSPCRQTKLRVVLLGPPKPPSPVPEGVEEPISPPTMGAYMDAPTTGTATRGGGAGSSLRDQLGAAQEEKEGIRKRLEPLEDRSAARGGSGRLATQQVRGGGGAGGMRRWQWSGQRLPA